MNFPYSVDLMSVSSLSGIGQTWGVCLQVFLDCNSHHPWLLVMVAEDDGS